MDEIDQKIVRELQRHARISNSDLATRVNLSPSPCLRRVRRLEQQGVIKGYAAIIDHEQYGLPLCVFVRIRLDQQTDKNIAQFEQHIQNIDEVMECYLMTGECDYILRVVSDSLKSYEKLIRERLTRIPGVGSLETSIAFGMIKRTTIYPKI